MTPFAPSTATGPSAPFGNSLGPTNGRIPSTDALLGALLSFNPDIPVRVLRRPVIRPRRPTPTTGDRGRRWRLIGKESPAPKVLSGTYENVAEVGTGRVALSMQRLGQGGILRNDFNDFNLESLRLSLSDL